MARAERILDGAANRFCATAAKLGDMPPALGALLITDGYGDVGYERMLAAADSQRPGGWTVVRNRDEISMSFSKADALEIVVVAGRQVRTREALEVLALGTRSDIEDGLDLRSAVERVVASGAVPVIPWGFGKWTGRRGALVKELLLDHDRPHLFVGDNANRPRFHRRPKLIGLAEQHGIQNLPGSDPLPFANSCERVAVAGVGLVCEIGADTSGRDLIKALRGQPELISPFFEYDRIDRFARNQVAMQLKRFRKREMSVQS